MVRPWRHRQGVSASEAIAAMVPGPRATNWAVQRQATRRKLSIAPDGDVFSYCAPTNS